MASIPEQDKKKFFDWPRVFVQLAELFEVQTTLQPCLPPKTEFEEGCRKFQAEEFKEK